MQRIISFLSRDMVMLMRASHIFAKAALFPLIDVDLPLMHAPQKKLQYHKPDHQKPGAFVSNIYSSFPFP